jgi:hypothetical protein
MSSRQVPFQNEALSILTVIGAAAPLILKTITGGGGVLIAGGTTPSFDRWER